MSKVSKKNVSAAVIEANAMEAAIRANPTPELLAAYEQFFGKKLEVALPEPREEVRMSKPVKSSPLKTNRVKRRATEPIDDEPEDDFDDGFEAELDNYVRGSRRATGTRTLRKSSGKSGQKACVARPFEPPLKPNFFDAKNERDPEILEADSWDKKAGRCPHTPRNREPFQKVIVACRKCHDEFEVSPALVPPSGRYVCNSCCATGG